MWSHSISTQPRLYSTLLITVLNYSEISLQVQSKLPSIWIILAKYVSVKYKAWSMSLQEEKIQEIKDKKLGSRAVLHSLFSELFQLIQAKAGLGEKLMTNSPWSVQLIASPTTQTFHSEVNYWLSQNSASSLSDRAVSLKSYFWFSYFHTCYEYIWSGLLLPPWWHKDCNILVSPVPEPLDSQKDTSAGEHFFVPMAAKEKIKTLIPSWFSTG